MTLYIALIILLHPVITEVMLDPLGPESGSLSPGDRNEFIELYNPSDDTIDVAVYRLRDNTELDSIVPFNEILSYYQDVRATTKIPPKGYGVILDREYVIYGENYLPYTFPGSISIMTTRDSDLGNGLFSNDTIALVATSAQVVSSFGLGSGFPLRSKDGVSFERKYYWGPDIAENWRCSEDSSGNTCGRENSVSHPFNIVITGAKFAPSGDYEVLFTLSLKNIGTEAIGRIKVGYELSGGYSGGDEERYVNLLPDSCVDVNLGPFSFPPGTYYASFSVIIPEADSSPIKTRTLRFFVGRSPLVINEIMYNSETEWIELFNNSADSISLLGFSVGDPVRRSAPLQETFWIPPGGYLVLSSKTLDVSGHFVLSNFPTLNNTGDTVFLYDEAGSCVDFVPYSSSWGGGYNISLERLCAQLPSNSKYNWSSSREGSTPAKPNSINIQPPQDNALLSLSSRVLAPSRGIPLLMVSLAFPSFPIYATAEMYRIDGRKVATFFEKKLLIDGKHSFVLESLISGKLLDEGMYILMVKAETLDGRTFVKRELIGVLD